LRDGSPASDDLLSHNPDVLRPCNELTSEVSGH